MQHNLICMANSAHPDLPADTSESIQFAKKPKYGFRKIRISGILKAILTEFVLFSN